MPVLSAHVRALEPGDKRSDGSGNGMECTWSGTSLAFHPPLERM